MTITTLFLARELSSGEILQRSATFEVPSDLTLSQLSSKSLLAVNSWCNAFDFELIDIIEVSHRSNSIDF